MKNDRKRFQDRGLGRRSFLSITALAATGLAAIRPVGSFAQQRGQSAERQLQRSPAVGTTAGRVRGLYDGTVYAFKGVPYAASTAGNRRFQPPEKREPWSGVRDTTQLGLRCPVPQSTAQAEYVVMDGREPAGEDCLCLNLWTRGLGDNGKRPVLLWLHGGGYRVGSAGHTVYDGSNLAENHDVVMVGANHRLNAFGYLHLAGTGLSRFEESSNVGLLDIVAALEWIRDNIENFGGDPNNVTIIGQSGGAGKVSSLLAMPAAKGLFHRAVAMSGSEVRSATEEEATETAERFLAAFDLKPSQAERILEIPYYDLREEVTRGRYSWGPVMDEDTLPTHPFDPVAPAVSKDVPLMIGSTETEITWNTQQHYDPIDDETLLTFAQRALDADEATTREIVSVYREGRPQASNLDLYLILASDASGFRVGTDTQAERKAELGGAPVYKYYFDWYSPVVGGKFRSMHTMDIPFFLDNVEAAKSLIGDSPDLQPMANRIAGAVVAFARNGTPNRHGLPQWEPFDTERRATMFLDQDMRQVEDPYREERLARANI